MNATSARLATWGLPLLLGLALPFLWALVTIAVPEDRLAAHDAPVVLEATVGPEVLRFSQPEPVHNLTVVRVIGGSEPPANLTTGGHLQAQFPLYAEDIARLRHASGTVTLALAPSDKHDIESGEVFWRGYVVLDGRGGRLWSSQVAALESAAVALVPSIAGGLLLGFAAGLPRRFSVRALLDAGPALTAGVALGLLAGGLVGTAHGSNLLFPRHADGLPVAGPIAYLVGLVGIATGFLQAGGPLRQGAWTASATGLGLLVALGTSLVLAWDRVTAGAYAPDSSLMVLTVLGGIGALGLAAVRLLALRRARIIAAVVLLGPALYLLVGASLFSAFALPLLVLGTAIARELVLPGA